MGKDMDSQNIEQVINQIEAENKLLPAVQAMSDADRKKVVQNLKTQRQQLNMDCTNIDKALASLNRDTKAAE